MRPDLEEFMRLYHRVIRFARINNGGLTDNECKAVLYFVIEIEKIEHPYEDLDDSVYRMEFGDLNCGSQSISVSLQVLSILI